MKYENDLNDLLIMNEYIKRYKAYVDSSISMNQYLENLNVIINYVYDFTFSSRECKMNKEGAPKFSIFRMMIGLWNNEVFEKINSRISFAERITNIYENYLTKEFNKFNSNTQSKHKNDIGATSVFSIFDKKEFDNSNFNFNESPFDSSDMNFGYDNTRSSSNLPKNSCVSSVTGSLLSFDSCSLKHSAERATFKLSNHIKRDDERSILEQYLTISYF
jgi:hypothetical protein